MSPLEVLDHANEIVELYALTFGETLPSELSPWDRYTNRELVDAMKHVQLAIECGTLELRKS